MDPPLINDASFLAMNPTGYSLAEIWPFGGEPGRLEESTISNWFVIVCANLVLEFGKWIVKTNLPKEPKKKLEEELGNLRFRPLNLIFWFRPCCWRGCRS
ncbi:hypothetical protein RchiOBHm_Chr5g0004721 [Rosa chinensis]|uniref:Uncharacterized protein n=1 Tax=Rosa chinensis TaxID=74649 RepID=A0A2P6Q329_ROSCH|nr:hypothetical protein RchiOBHm_Chr5g0004721 [Rosa chinensis]